MILFVCLFVLFCSLTMNEKFQYRTRPPSAALKIFDNDVKEVVASKPSVTWYKSTNQKIGIRTVYES